MGMSSSKTKTKSTTSSTPLDQYAPYINQGLTSAQGTLDANQGNLQNMSGSAYDLYNKLAGTVNSPTGFVSGAQNAASSIYNGNGPSADTYKTLQNVGANNPSTALLAKFANGGNDPSMGVLGQLAQGSKSPGSYDGIGANNPAIAALMGMTHQEVNGDTKGFYQDTLSGKYLNNNPYIDTMAKQAEDAALKSVNQRYAASGMGEGMSTPYAQAAGSSVADANNTLRYTNYNNELNRMGQIGGQSDSMYNATQDRSVNAANLAGNQYNASGQLQLGAQQAKDASFNNDRGAQLAAAQSLGSQYSTGQGQQIAAAQGLGSQYNADNQTALGAANGNMQSILSALGMTGELSNAQYAGVNPALNALTSAANIPYAGTQNYANLINGLTAKYGNQSTNSTTTQSSNIGQMLTGLAGGALASFGTGGLGSMLGGLGGAAGGAANALTTAGINPMGWPMQVNSSIPGLG